MTAPFPWTVLGIEPTSDRKAIRKAYADAVKGMDLDADVEGYARLRSARDIALRQALQQEPASSPPGNDAPVHNAPDGQGPATSQAEEGWTLRAPRLARAPDDGIPEGRVLASSPPGADAPADGTARFAAVFPEVPCDSGTGATLELGANRSLVAPTLYGYGEIEAALGLIPGQSPFERLRTILTEDSAPVLEEPSRIVARRALGAVIEDARSGDITHLEQVDDWLADTLFKTWPRSAPLLEEATKAFGWQSEWHRFDARPSVRFLGAQLRAERFRAHVENPSHRYHRAWRELKRTGPAGPFRLLRANRDDIRFVLKGIRENFAQLEDELDPQRVASWAKPLIWPRVALGLCWLLLLAHLLGVNWPFGPRSFETPDGTRIELPDEAPDAKALARHIDGAIADSFGAGHDLDWLYLHDPDLGQAIVLRMRDRLRSGSEPAQIYHEIANIVRQRSYVKGRGLSGEPLEATMRLRLDQLRAARDDSPASCLSALDTAQLPASVGLSEALRERERHEAAQLASVPMPKDERAAPSGTIHIPGPLVARILAATGLDETTVREALQDKGEDATRCTVAITLLESTLDWDGPAHERTAILHSL